jgi:alpha-1,6-mannosyltransferase
VLDRERPDVIEASSPWLGGWAGARWPGRSLKSFFLHNDPVAAYPQALLGDRLGKERVDRLFGWFWSYMRRLRRHFDTMVVSSQWMAGRLQRFGLPRPAVVGFGVEPGLFSPSLRDEGMRRAMLAACGIDDPGAPLLIAVGRHHPEKKIVTILDTFAIASHERRMGLFLIGDGLYRRHVERRAARIPGVHVAGAVTDRPLLARQMASADLFLHGAGFETFGLAVAEALRSGTPLVVPDTGGAAELAAPAYAETYPVGDAQAGALAVATILARNLPLLRLNAAAAGQAIRSPESHFDDLFDYYGRLVRGRQQASAPAIPDTVWDGEPPATDATPA